MKNAANTPNGKNSIPTHGPKRILVTEKGNFTVEQVKMSRKQDPLFFEGCRGITPKTLDDFISGRGEFAPPSAMGTIVGGSESKKPHAEASKSANSPGKPTVKNTVESKKKWLMSILESHGITKQEVMIGGGIAAALSAFIVAGVAFVLQDEPAPTKKKAASTHERRATSIGSGRKKASEINPDAEDSESHKITSNLWWVGKASQASQSDALEGKEEWNASSTSEKSKKENRVQTQKLEAQDDPNYPPAITRISKNEADFDVSKFEKNPEQGARQLKRLIEEYNRSR